MNLINIEDLTKVYAERKLFDASSRIFVLKLKKKR